MTTKQLKRVGYRVLQVCEIVDRLGACRSSNVHDVLGIDKDNIIKYLQRANGLGLIEVDRTVKPSIFRVTTGWRDMLPRPRTEPYKRPATVRIAAGPMLATAIAAQRTSFPLAGVWA
jgi:hypothetical protein